MYGGYSKRSSFEGGDGRVRGRKEGEGVKYAFPRRKLTSQENLPNP